MKGAAAANVARLARGSGERLSIHGLGAHREPGLLRERFYLVEMSHQFVFRSPTGEVELNHL